MTDDTIYPTHTCFDDALELIHSLLQSAADKGINAESDLLLVHAICTGPHGPYAHAWVEDSSECRSYFVGILNGERIVLAAHTSDYEQSLNVTESTKYGWSEAFALNRKHETYGPWKPEYQALCKNDDHKTWRLNE